MQTSSDSEVKIISFIDEANPSEMSLWSDFQKGDPVAFEAMVSRYYPGLLNYGMRLIRDKDFVQDCLQDFLVDLWERKGRLDDVRSIQGYLFLSFRRRLFREMKRGKWVNMAIELDESLDFEGYLTIESVIIESEQHAENSAKLHKELGNLTKRQREAIYLRFNQSLDYEQISDMMQINQQSAVNLVYEAIRMLKKNWFVSISFLYAALS